MKETKPIQIFIDKKIYKIFEEKAEELGLSVSGFGKIVILKYLGLLD